MFGNGDMKAHMILKNTGAVGPIGRPIIQASSSTLYIRQ